MIQITTTIGHVDNIYKERLDDVLHRISEYGESIETAMANVKKTSIAGDKIWVKIRETLTNK